MNSKLDRARSNAWMSLVSWGVVILGAIGYLVACYRIRRGVADDAFISFRFARNLAEGHGLVWNVGGEPVEGYTNALWVFLLAAMNRLGFDIEVVSQVFSVAATLGTAAIVLAIMRRQDKTLHPWVALLVALYLLDDYTVIHSVSGMETQLFVFLLSLATFLAVRFQRAPSVPGALGLAAAMFLAVLCRPDAVLFVGGTMLALGVWALPRRGSGMNTAYIQRLGLCAVVLAVLLSGYAIWKYDYFNYLLPNSFYVKSSPDNVLALAGRGAVFTYFGHLFIWIGPPLFLMCAAIVVSSLVGGRRDRASGERFDLPGLLRERTSQVVALMMLLPPAVALGYYLTIIHEVGFGARFSYPTYYYFILWAAYLLVAATRQWATGAKAVHLVTFIVVAAVVVRGDWRLEEPPYHFYDHHENIARALERTGLGPAATVMTVAAGQVPYRSRFRHIDPVGLTDNYVSGRSPITLDAFEDYLWRQRPDVYLGREPPAQTATGSAEEDPLMRTWYVEQILLAPLYPMQWDHPRYAGRTSEKLRELLYRRMRELRDGYIWLGQIEEPWFWRHVGLKAFVYVRADSPHLNALVEALGPLVDVAPAMALAGLNDRPPPRERVSLVKRALDRLLGRRDSP